MNATEGLYCRSVCEAAVAMSSTRSRRVILRNLVERVANTLSAKGCAILLFSHDKKHLFHVTAFGLSARHIKKGPVLADNSIAETVKGKTVTVLNAAEDERSHYRLEAQREGISSILSMPMTFKDDVIGVIRVYTSEPHQFTDDDIYLTNAVASLAAVALENAKWYSSVKRDNVKLKQELMEITHLMNS
jgi:transcriptional regulator with GAF, ATPase, and Fis domain